jgi:TRAP-type C4-dicarboxylate transport system permease large subunit
MLRAVGAETLKASAMILWITLGAKAYVAIFTGLGGADALLQFIQGLEVNRWLILGAMMLLLIFLGTVLDELGIILLTVPVFLPIVRLLGLTSCGSACSTPSPSRWATSAHLSATRCSTSKARCPKTSA